MPKFFAVWLIGYADSAASFADERLNSSE